MDDEQVTAGPEFLSLTEGQFAAVGRVAVGAAWLEAELARLCGVLLASGNARVAAVTDGMSMHALGELIKRLVPTHAEATKKSVEISALLGRCKDAAEDRNRVVHGLIMPLSGSVTTVGLLSRRRSRQEGVETTIKEIHDIADALDQLGWEVSEMADSLLTLQF